MLTDVTVCRCPGEAKKVEEPDPKPSTTTLLVDGLELVQLRAELDTLLQHHLTLRLASLTHETFMIHPAARSLESS